MSYCRPASQSFSQRARPWRAGTLTSKPSSPVKETRKSRAGKPATVHSATDMCGKAASEMSRPSTKGSSSLRAFGPLSATVAHCSVVEVSQTLRSGHSVWR